MTDSADGYQLIDSGAGEKLERVGPWRMSRPCPQAVWPRRLPAAEWNRADAHYERSNTGGGEWQFRRPLPAQWEITLQGQPWIVKTTGFGHLGLFLEQQENWQWLTRQAQEGSADAHYLNLFAYTGGSTLALARGGGHVAHVDAAKGVVQWGRENARLQGLEKAPVQWLVEDAAKFCLREQRRGRLYHGIVLDPPTFGRGPSGELWKIEEHLVPLLEQCRALLAPTGRAFVLLSCHSPGFSPLVLENLLVSVLGTPSRMESAEMLVSETGGRPLPSGCHCRWIRHG